MLPASKPYAFAVLSERGENHLHCLSSGEKKIKGTNKF